MFKFKQAELFEITNDFALLFDQLESFDEIEEAEMREIMGPDFREACDNTLEIAEKCDVTLPRGTCVPNFPLPEGETTESFFRKKCEEGLTRLVSPRSPETQTYWDRYETEASTIAFFGLADYFLIVQELVNWARERGICVGPGRGSAGDSLVNWLLGITEIDPIAHGLVFDRFMPLDNFDTIPDIDLDFESGRRDEVIRHIKGLYGEDHVSGLAAYGRTWARNAVHDATRLLGYPYPVGDRLCKMLPVSPNITLADAIEQSPGLRAANEQDREAHEILETAGKLEGRVYHRGMHACAVVLCSDPISDHVPLGRDLQGQDIITQFDAPSAEAAGLMKLDLLPLRALDTISATCKLVNEHYGARLTPETIPVEDEEAFTMLLSGDTAGVFMVDKPGYQRFFQNLPSVSFEDVVASVALAERPGPLASGMTDEYLDIRRGTKAARQFDSRLDGILAETGGMIIYQEQLMRIAIESCGFSPSMANRLRKAMAKNQEGLLADLKERWDSGPLCRSNPKLAEDLWNEALRYGAYLFSKAHAVGYAMLIMRTAYLKAYWPELFQAASSQN